MTLQNNKLLEMHRADYFIHPSIRRNPDLLYRARILILTIFTLLFTSGSILVAMPFIPDFSGYLFALVWFICLVGMISMSYALYKLKKDASYVLCCLMTIIAAFFNIALASVFSGGPSYSPAIQVLVVPCVAAFFFGGLRWGIVMSLLALVFILTTMAAAFSGFSFPMLTQAVMELNIKYTAFLVNFGIIAALSFFYETTSITVKKERDLQHEKFTVLAKTDSLTGLPNRRIFTETLAARIALYSTMTPPRRFALCYLDLDRFKPINDQFGHVVGDEVLKVISNRLHSALRGADFICRHGGDEFLLLLDEVNDPRAIAGLAARFLDLLREPIATEVGPLSVGCSIGFAIYPDHSSDVTALEKAADAAMYAAKKNQLGWKIFNADLTNGV